MLKSCFFWKEALHLETGRRGNPMFLTIALWRTISPLLWSGRSKGGSTFDLSNTLLPFFNRIFTDILEQMSLFNLLQYRFCFMFSFFWPWGMRIFAPWTVPNIYVLGTSPVVKTLPSNVRGVASIPGQGAKILYIHILCCARSLLWHEGYLVCGVQTSELWHGGSSSLTRDCIGSTET